jgi:hypothetical protein
MGACHKRKEDICSLKRSDYIIHTWYTEKKYTEYNEDYWQQEAGYNAKIHGLKKQFQSSRNLSPSPICQQSLSTSSEA